MKIKSICIVGGGSAGWMTASAFSSLLTNIKITLVESPIVSKIGVGESTMPEIHEFLDAINVSDRDWMKECDASYKMGLRFVDFLEKGHSFVFPFYNPAKIKPPKDWFFFKQRNRNFPYSYTDYITPEISLMCENNKMTGDKFVCMNKNMGYRNYSYQVDADKFAKFLMNKVAIPRGTTHILDHVVDFNVVDEKLKSIKTQNGLTIEADLFVDCTGFKSLLLEKVFKSKHIPFTKLLNDSAFFTPIQYEESEQNKEKEMEVVTDCVAMNNGWIWNTPLWSRIGTGYVYSSKYTDKESAKIEFMNYLSRRFGENRVRDLEPRSLEIRNGKHEKCWVSNVIAIGLSYGFIEPLESTGLYLVHDAILKVAHLISRRDGHVGRAEISAFNIQWDDHVSFYEWFVSMHFFLTKRDDTEYWKQYSDKMEFDYETIFSNNGSMPLNIFRTTNFLQKINRFVHDNSLIGVNYIAYNMDVLPISYISNFDRTYDLHYEKENEFIKSYKDIIPLIEKLPSHYQFLKENIYL